MMMKVKCIPKIVIGILLVFPGLTNSQPSFVFNGGTSDGYAEALIISTGDFLSEGGYNDGSVMKLLASDLFFLVDGHSGDGYTSNLVNSQSSILTSGGTSDGYDMDESFSSNSFISDGGESDGYDSNVLKEKFIWTGAVGTGWNVMGNWNHNEVPDIERPVVIPSGVPNYPFVNAGLFSIGENPSGGLFVCESLCILNGATLTTRQTNRIENYGLIEIIGTMRVKKQTPDAFQNFETGQVIVREEGLLNIKP